MFQVGQKLPGFVKLDRDKIVGSQDVLHANESLVQGIVSHAAMQVLSATQFGTEVYVGNGRTDCLIINDKSKKAIIIALKYEGDSSEAVRKMIKEVVAQKFSPRPLLTFCAQFHSNLLHI